MFEIRPLSTTPRPPVERFLHANFDEEKARFLQQHGDWWHRGAENRYVVVDRESEAVAAYFNTTPTAIIADGQAHETIWWIDLIVSPDFRRRGLQKLMDDSVQTRPGLKLGFPNQFHSVILGRHGWAVRADARKFLLPLSPRRLRSVQNASGAKGHAVRLGATLLEPVALLLKRQRRRYRPLRAFKMSAPSSTELAGVFERHWPQTLFTTRRDAELLQWRYFDCPYFDQLHFYGSGDPLTHYAIVRHVTFGGLPMMRILDLYGDLEDERGLRDLLLTIARDAVQLGVEQVTLMATHTAPSGLRRALRKCGFWLTIPVYFCHHSSDATLMQRLRDAPAYWTLADSDNDDQY